MSHRIEEEKLQITLWFETAHTLQLKLLPCDWQFD